MVSPVDQQRVCALLTEAVTVICKNGLNFTNKICIEGLLGITLDDRNMFLVNIKETLRKGDTNQNKSESMSKAGVTVTGSLSMQANGGRGASTGGMRHPGGGMHQGVMHQQMQRRRPGGPQPQVLPPKRPVQGHGLLRATGPAGQGGPVMQEGAGRGGSMPQEWAALIQLQTQQQRGRGSRGTARRGMASRMQVTTMRSPQRRLSQSGVELESREEIERKAAEQARSRSERLQRRKALSGEAPIPPTASERTAAATGSSAGETSEGASKASGNEAATTSETAPDTGSDGNKKDRGSGEAGKQEHGESDDTSGRHQAGNDGGIKQQQQQQLQQKQQSDERTDEKQGAQRESGTTEASPTSATTADGGERKTKGGEGSETGAGTKEEGDGSWLLSNSGWLLGDLESMTPGEPPSSGRDCSTGGGS